jgi:hypothetical protein
MDKRRMWCRQPAQQCLQLPYDVVISCAQQQVYTHHTTPHHTTSSQSSVRAMTVAHL